MSWRSDLIYRSQNGDAWLLLRKLPDGRIVLRHEANAASGGDVTDLSVEEFLAIDGPGMEHRAVRQLLAELARRDRPGAPT